MNLSAFTKVRNTLRKQDLTAAGGRVLTSFLCPRIQTCAYHCSLTDFRVSPLSVVQEVTVGEAPILMTLVYTSSHESLVCVGYKHQFDLISEAGDVSKIHSVDKQEVLKCLCLFVAPY